MKTYAISDIHGCYYTFKELLSTIGLTKDDNLYLLGDYINRGPNSKEVIDYIIELQQQGYNILALNGNHEEMVFDSIDLEDWTAGANETLLSFGIHHLKNLDAKYVRWFSNLLPFAEREGFIMVHAGLNFNNLNPLSDKKSMAWITDWYNDINSDWLGKRKIIHGHVPIERKKIEKMMDNIDLAKVMNIDNGCYLKEQSGFGSLCCVELSSLALTFQKNID